MQGGSMTEPSSVAKNVVWQPGIIPNRPGVQTKKAEQQVQVGGHDWSAKLSEKLDTIKKKIETSQGRCLKNLGKELLSVHKELVKYKATAGNNKELTTLSNKLLEITKQLSDKKGFTGLLNRLDNIASKMSTFTTESLKKELAAAERATGKMNEGTMKAQITSRIQELEEEIDEKKMFEDLASLKPQIENMQVVEKEDLKTNQSGIKNHITEDSLEVDVNQESSMVVNEKKNEQINKDLELADKYFELIGLITDEKTSPEKIKELEQEIEISKMYEQEITSSTRVQVKERLDQKDVANPSTAPQKQAPKPLPKPPKLTTAKQIKGNQTQPSISKSEFENQITSNTVDAKLTSRTKGELKSIYKEFFKEAKSQLLAEKFDLKQKLITKPKDITTNFLLKENTEKIYNLYKLKSKKTNKIESKALQEKKPEVKEKKLIEIKNIETVKNTLISNTSLVNENFINSYKKLKEYISIDEKTALNCSDITKKIEEDTNKYFGNVNLWLYVLTKPDQIIARLNSFPKKLSSEQDKIINNLHSETFCKLPFIRECFVEKTNEEGEIKTEFSLDKFTLNTKKKLAQQIEKGKLSQKDHDKLLENLQNSIKDVFTNSKFRQSPIEYLNGGGKREDNVTPRTGLLDLLKLMADNGLIDGSVK